MNIPFKKSHWLLIAIVSFLTAACSDATGDNKPAISPSTTQQADFDIYKSPTCGCCGKWVDHMTDHGFNARVHHSEKLDVLKREHGISPQYQSCHTAVSQAGYVFEGHIPARFVSQFLNSPPENALGLAVPGMPMGSPGMEVGDRFTPYQVLLLKSDGTSEVYATIRSPEEQYR